jgi:hypothetical protein
MLQIEKVDGLHGILWRAPRLRGRSVALTVRHVRKATYRASEIELVNAGVFAGTDARTDSFRFAGHPPESGASMANNWGTRRN